MCLQASIITHGKSQMDPWGETVYGAFIVKIESWVSSARTTSRVVRPAEVTHLITVGRLSTLVYWEATQNDGSRWYT